jgi:ATP sulfurylase
MVMLDNQYTTSIQILGETRQNEKRHPEGAVITSFGKSLFYGRIRVTLLSRQRRYQKFKLEIRISKSETNSKH